MRFRDLGVEKAGFLPYSLENLEKRTCRQLRFRSRILIFLKIKQKRLYIILFFYINVHYSSHSCTNNKALNNFNSLLRLLSAKKHSLSEKFTFRPWNSALDKRTIIRNGGFAWLSMNKCKFHIYPTVALTLLGGHTHRQKDIPSHFDRFKKYLANSYLRIG